MTDSQLYSIANAGQATANIVHTIDFIGFLIAVAGWLAGTKTKKVNAPEIWPDGFSPKGRADHKRCKGALPIKWNA